jgi:hypothetical protein
MATKSGAAEEWLPGDAPFAAPAASEDRSAELAAAADRLEFLGAEARRRRWRTVVFGSLLAGVPAVALAVLVVTMGERVKAAMEEALARDSAPVIARLEERGRAAESALQRLLQRGEEAEAASGRRRQMADTARPQLDRLEQQAASHRGELARLDAELAATLKAHSPLLAELGRQQAASLTRLEALRKDAESDRAQIKRLQAEVATLLQERGLLVAEVRSQGTDLGTRLDRLLAEAGQDRTDLARLRAQVGSPSPPAADPQRTALVEEVMELRQELSAHRSGLSRLQGEVAAIRRAPSRPKQPATAPDLSSIAALPGPGGATAEAPPASRSPVLATLPVDGVRPRTASLAETGDGQTGTVAPAARAAGDVGPVQSGGRFAKGALGCTRYKTYDAQTQTYRSRSGVVRPCRPL